MRIARVFPRKTNASPTDDLAYFGPPGLFPPQVDEVHVSVAFTWDLAKAEGLAREWRHVAPVSIGGPGTGQRGEEFTPGVYLKPGYTITSRGCPNSCWFCEAWRREGSLRELPICEGWNVLDDNLLACSDRHASAVFDMLARQPERARFTGGIEAARLQSWQADRIAALSPQRVYLAYDTADDWEPVEQAVRMLKVSGVTTSWPRPLRCFVLMGYPRDTHEEANRRCQRVLDLGIMPMAMLWKDEREKTLPGWKALQREWANPFILGSKMAGAST